MTKQEFIKLMKYPTEWETLNMLPEQFLNLQIADYTVSSDSASEHYRHGALQYWLKTEATSEILRKLVILASVDPDHLMGMHFVKNYITTHINCNDEVKKEIIRVGY